MTSRDCEVVARGEGEGATEMNPRQPDHEHHKCKAHHSKSAKGCKARLHIDVGPKVVKEAGKNNHGNKGKKVVTTIDLTTTDSAKASIGHSPSTNDNRQLINERIHSQPHHEVIEVIDLERDDGGGGGGEAGSSHTTDHAVASARKKKKGNHQSSPGIRNNTITTTITKSGKRKRPISGVCGLCWFPECADKPKFSDVLKHVRDVHLEWSPYICTFPDCSHRATLRSNLQRHVLEHHLNQPHSSSSSADLQVSVAKKSKATPPPPPSSSSNHRQASAVVVVAKEDPDAYIRVCQDSMDRVNEYFVEHQDRLSTTRLQATPVTTTVTTEQASPIQVEPVENDAENSVGQLAAAVVEQQQQQTNQQIDQHYEKRRCKTTGGVLILYKGCSFSFRRKLKANGQLVFQCSKRIAKKCRVRLYFEGGRIVKIENDHNHPIGKIVRRPPPPSPPNQMMNVATVDTDKEDGQLAANTDQISQSGLDNYNYNDNNSSDNLNINIKLVSKNGIDWKLASPPRAPRPPNQAVNIATVDGQLDNNNNTGQGLDNNDSNHVTIVLNKNNTNWIYGYKGFDFRETYLSKRKGDALFCCSKKNTKERCKASLRVANGVVIEEHNSHNHKYKSPIKTNPSRGSQGNLVAGASSASIAIGTERSLPTISSLASLCLAELIRQSRQQQQSPLAGAIVDCNETGTELRFCGETFRCVETYKTVDDCRRFKCAKEDCEFTLLIHENEIVKLIGAHKHHHHWGESTDHAVEGLNVASYVDLPFVNDDTTTTTNHHIDASSPDDGSALLVVVVASQAPDSTEFQGEFQLNTGEESQKFSDHNDHDYDGTSSPAVSPATPPPPLPPPDGDNDNLIVDNIVGCAAAPPKEKKILMFVCEKCHKTCFRSQEELKHHLLVEHHKVLPYKCGWPDCTEKTKTEQLMADHIRSTHIPISTTNEDNTDLVMAYVTLCPAVEDFAQTIYPPGHKFKTKKLKLVHRSAASTTTHQVASESQTDQSEQQPLQHKHNQQLPTTSTTTNADNHPKFTKESEPEPEPETEIITNKICSDRPYSIYDNATEEDCKEDLLLEVNNVVNVVNTDTIQHDENITNNNITLTVVAPTPTSPVVSMSNVNDQVPLLLLCQCTDPPTTDGLNSDQQRAHLMAHQLIAPYQCHYKACSAPATFSKADQLSHITECHLASSSNARDDDPMSYLEVAGFVRAENRHQMLMADGEYDFHTLTTNAATRDRSKMMRQQLAQLGQHTNGCTTSGQVVLPNQCHYPRCGESFQARVQLEMHIEIAHVPFASGLVNKLGHAYLDQIDLVNFIAQLNLDLTTTNPSPPSSSC